MELLCFWVIKPSKNTRILYHSPFYDPFYTSVQPSQPLYDQWWIDQQCTIHSRVRLTANIFIWVLVGLQLDQDNLCVRVPCCRKLQYVSKGWITFFVAVIHKATRPAVCTVSGEWFSNKSDPSPTVLHPGPCKKKQQSRTGSQTGGLSQCVKLPVYSIRAVWRMAAQLRKPPSLCIFSTFG